MASLQCAQGAYGSGGKPLHLCPNCGAYIFDATWSERVSEIRIRAVWSCDSCGCEYETSVYLAAEADAN